MSTNETQLQPFTLLSGIIGNKEKASTQSSNSTQSTIAKPTQGAKVIGSYLLGKNIGNGSFGKVYLAMHIPTSEKVAVKVIDKQKMNSIDVKRVKCEIQILKTVRHRHIVHLYEVIQTEKSVLLVTQYLPNGQLFQHIIKQKKIGELEACAYFQQIISAVQYLHRNKIAHRDLKPENILLDSDKQLKIIDFGLGSFYKNDLKTFCGSPCYAAPEIVAAKKHYNPRQADLWSCGVILYSMLCGHLPFCDPDAKTLYKKVLGGSYKVPSYVSPEGKSLIEGLLTLAPNKRMDINQIKKHKWFNLVPPREAYGLDIGEYLPPDSHLLNRLASLGIKQDNVRSGIIKNEKNKDTAAYFIMMKKVVKGGDLIPSFIGDDNFNQKLIEKACKKMGDDDTESFNNSPDIIIIQSPEAPEIPQEDEIKQSATAAWWFDDHTSEEIQQIDHSELTFFAQSILDVIISKYTLKPSIQKVNEILWSEQKSEKLFNIISEKREDRFYTNNREHKKKVRDFQAVNKEDSKQTVEMSNLMKKSLNIQSLKQQTSKRRFTLKKLASLQNPERRLSIMKTISMIRQPGQPKNTLPVLPKIPKRIGSKLEVRIKHLEKIYGVQNTDVPDKKSTKFLI